MNLAAAPNAGPLKRLKTVMAADLAVSNGKCSLLFAPLAEKKPWCLSSHPVTDLFTAVIAINPVHAATGNLTNVYEAFPDFLSGKAYVFSKSFFSSAAPGLFRPVTGAPGADGSCSSLIPYLLYIG